MLLLSDAIILCLRFILHLDFLVLYIFLHTAALVQSTLVPTSLMKMVLHLFHWFCHWPAHMSVEMKIYIYQLCGVCVCNIFPLLLQSALEKCQNWGYSNCKNCLQ